jgi:hypothetical protein
MQDTNGKEIPLWRWVAFALACMVFPPLLGITIVFVFIAGVVWLFNVFFDR